MNSRVCLLPAIFFAAVLALASNPSRSVAADSDKPQYYELRVYTTSSAAQQKRVNDYWQKAAVAAYNRMGIQPIGVFTELEDSATNHIYALIPCDSQEILAAIPAKLAADADYQKVAAEYLSATKSDAAFDRFESSLLIAFDGMKHIAVPPPDKKPNIFELRTYMSSSEGRGLNKVEMFNSGEIPLMQDVGLAPVFYGRTLIGAKMPCLTYMLSGESLEAHKEHWHGFSSSPVWKKLSSDPRFQDNVSGIISIMLKRTSASQI